VWTGFAKPKKTTPPLPPKRVDSNGSGALFEALLRHIPVVCHPHITGINGDVRDDLQSADVAAGILYQKVIQADPHLGVVVGLRRRAIDAVTVFRVSCALFAYTKAGLIATHGTTAEMHWLIT
jgi:hypothetical protein